MVDFKDLVKAGIHFGHQTSRWNPKMAPYIWGFRGGIHLIDVSKTAHYLEKAAKFLELVAAENKQILFVGTKKAAQEVVEKWAKELKMPYVTNRWIGGTLTNFSQVKKSVTKLLHFEDIIARSSQFSYTKKELLTFQKVVDRLQQNVGGIRNLKWPIGAVIIIDVRKEKTVLSEAKQAGLPVVALVDTNSDPKDIDYIIPGNDDSPKAVKFIVEYLGEAVKRGIAEAVKKAKEEQQKTESTDKHAGEGAEKTVGKVKTVARNLVEKVTSKVAKKETEKKPEEQQAETSGEVIQEDVVLKEKLPLNLIDDEDEEGEVEFQIQEESIE